MLDCSAVTSSWEYWRVVLPYSNVLFGMLEYWNNGVLDFKVSQPSTECFKLILKQLCFLPIIPSLQYSNIPILQRIHNYAPAIIPLTIK